MVAESRTDRGLISRMKRALRLEPQLYEEVEADSGATGQAMLVVILVSVIAGIGFVSTGGVVGLLAGVGIQLLGWALWAWLNYFIGAKLVPESGTEANWGQLARAMGFASSPRIFLLLTLIPVAFLQGLIGIVVNVWMWIAMVIAVRQALDYKSTLRAVGVTLLGFLINAVAISTVAILLD